MIFTLFASYITPELSRPVAGRRTRASVAHSTWPTPRHGVGLNELLDIARVVLMVKKVINGSEPENFCAELDKLENF